MGFDVKRFDIYRKVPKDLTQPTVTGAFISICSCLFMLYLFLNELSAYLSTELVSELFVDETSHPESRIPVFLDMTFPRLSCEYLGLDIVDESNRHEVGKVNASKTATIDGAGCRFKANFELNKVPGNFHVSTHSADSQPNSPNMQHTVNSLTFGNDTRISDVFIPGSFDNLKNNTQISASETVDGGVSQCPMSAPKTEEAKLCFSFESIKSSNFELETHEYVLKIVPTIHETLNGKRFDYYQYTFAHKRYIAFTLSGTVMPAVYFRYDLNPITVRYTEKRQPFYVFLTSICAIIGGTFTVAGIIDSFVFTASEFYRKFEIGKLS